MITKILLFVFIFSILNTLYELYKFILAVRKGEPDMTKGRRIGLGLSIAYILTILITGFLI